jgi:hypothetical protein
MARGVARRVVGKSDHSKPRHGGNTIFLVYGAEAVLPSELSLGWPCVALYNEANMDDLHRDDLDYLEERRR